MLPDRSRSWLMCWFVRYGEKKDFADCNAVLSQNIINFEKIRLEPTEFECMVSEQRNEGAHGKGPMYVASLDGCSSVVKSYTRFPPKLQAECGVLLVIVCQVGSTDVEIIPTCKYRTQPERPIKMILPGSNRPTQISLPRQKFKLSVQLNYRCFCSDVVRNSNCSIAREGLQFFHMHIII